MTPAPLNADVLVALGSSQSKHVLLGTNYYVSIMTKILKIPCSRKSQKLLSFRRIGWRAILFKNLSNAKRLFSINSADVA